MDEIIDSPGDVSLLHARSIIQNSLGSNNVVAGLFNWISEEVTVDPESSLVEVSQELHKYCKKKRNPCFRSPCCCAIAGRCAACYWARNLPDYVQYLTILSIPSS